MRRWLLITLFSTRSDGSARSVLSPLRIADVIKPFPADPPREPARRVGVMADDAMAAIICESRFARGPRIG